MNFNRINWRIALGWIVVISAIAAVLFIWQTHQKPGADGDSVKFPVKTARSASPADAAFKITARDRKSRLAPEPDRAASNRLRDHFAAGELNAIQEELAALAETHRLADVSDVLKNWCRAGSLELAQWSLVFSQESDPELNLTLCAEALSNPSEVIREIAAGQLEGSSGIRFADTANAKAWLAARPAAP